MKAKFPEKVQCKKSQNHVKKNRFHHNTEVARSTARRQNTSNALKHVYSQINNCAYVTIEQNILVNLNPKPPERKIVLQKIKHK